MLKESLSHVDVERSGIIEYTEEILKQCGFDDYDAMKKAELQINDLNKQVRELAIELEYLDEVINERFTTDNMEELNAGLDIEIGTMINEVSESAYDLLKVGDIVKREVQRQQDQSCRRKI